MTDLRCLVGLHDFAVGETSMDGLAVNLTCRRCQKATLEQVQGYKWSRPPISLDTQYIPPPG